MNTRPWHQSKVILLLAVLILPLAGFILLWLQRNLRVFNKVLISLVVVAYGFVHLVGICMMLVHYQIVEPSGKVFTFFLRYANTESHYSYLEENRARQQETLSTKTEPLSGFSAYWTSFRGPDYDGIYKQMDFRWETNELQLLWKQPIGGGYASFAIAQGVAYTIEQRRENEVAAAYDLLTGKELWTRAWEAHFQEAMGGPGPRATPTWHDGLLYVLGATGELYCLDTAKNGEPVWHLNILIHNQADNKTWGMAASPLVIDDIVVVAPGGRKNNSIVAYDRMTGDRRWSALNDEVDYSSPIYIDLLDIRQIVFISHVRVVGLSAVDGSMLWEYPWETPNSYHIAQPVRIDSRRLFLSAGYGYGCETIELARPENEGRITASLAWKNRHMKNKMSSSVYYEGHLYGLDETVLACLDAATGERKWKGGRYGHGQLLLASGHLVILTESGDLAIVKATPASHQEILRVPAITGKTWNYPALSDGLLLARNASEMACFRIVDKSI